jgi:hypothetical protein
MALPSATILDYLDQHAGAFTALLSLVLIVVTAYYALQNRRMVKEMERTRELSLLPKLALEFHRLGPVTVTLAIHNVGPGSALDVDVRMIYKPADERGVAAERLWRRNVLVSGGRYDFFPPGELGDSINSVPATYSEIRLVGSMRDANGTRHEVDEVFADLPKWREVLRSAGQRFASDDPERRLADAFADRFRAPIASVSKELQALTRGVGRLVPPEPRQD